jgi:hypothetical protein
LRASDLDNIDFTISNRRNVSDAGVSNGDPERVFSSGYSAVGRIDFARAKVEFGQNLAAGAGNPDQ